MTETLATALTDVRRAYRLLWAYQQRVFDIVAKVAGCFEELNFYFWDAELGGRPCTGGTHPGVRPGWSLLPVSDISILYLSSKDPNAPKAGDWMLECRIRSDTGIDMDADGIEPTYQHLAEDAASVLELYAWRCRRDSRLNWYHGLWERVSWPQKMVFSVEVTDDFTVIGATFDLTELATEDAVLDAVASFKSMLAAHGGEAAGQD